MTRSKSESSMAAAAKYLGVPKSVNKQQRCFFILSNTSASWEHLHYWIVNHLWKFMDTSCFLKLLLDWSQYWYWWNHTNINKKIKINDKELYNSGNLGIIRKIVWQKKSCPDQCTEVRFARFLSVGFTTMAVINPPERKQAKRTFSALRRFGEFRFLLVFVM